MAAKSKQTPSPRPSSKGVRSVADQAELRLSDQKHPGIPTPFELAQLAATLSSAGKMSASAAVSAAYDLWTESVKRIEKELEHSKQIEASDLVASNIPRPPAFPAGLDQFLKLIVKAKPTPVARKRFSRFLKHSAQRRDQDHSAKAIESSMKDWETRGFPSLDSWIGAAKTYLAWWQGEKSISSKRSARKRNSAR